MNTTIPSTDHISWQKCPHYHHVFRNNSYIRASIGCPLNSTWLSRLLPWCISKFLHIVVTKIFYTFFFIPPFNFVLRSPVQSKGVCKPLTGSCILLHISQDATSFSVSHSTFYTFSVTSVDKSPMQLSHIFVYDAPHFANGLLCLFSCL